MGKAGADSDKKHVWVMTLNKEFNEVTFWAPKAHKNYKLKHRIDPWESKYLGHYLSPKLKKEEREEIEKIRKE